MVKAVKSPSTLSAADRAAHDAVMKDIAELRGQTTELLDRIESDRVHAEYIRNGWIYEGRAPRDGTQDIDAALVEAFPDGVYPRSYEAKRKKLKPIYDREGWGEVPDRFVIGRAIKRLQKRP